MKTPSWLLACIFAVSHAAMAQSAIPRTMWHGSTYWGDRDRGWHFYEDPPPEPSEPEPSKAPAPAVPDTKIAPSKPPEIVQFELLQKTLEEYRNIAIISPTEANVRRYMELEAKVVAQASRFADVAQRVAWSTPELDPTLQGRPVNAKALEVFEQDQLQSRSRSIAELGRDHVLVFFFRSDCPYCHALAPTLEAFSSRHGIRIEGVSIDGGGIPGFTRPRRDNGIARALNVTQVPAIFLAQPFTGKLSAVGFGVLSESQLLERLAQIAASPADSSPPAANPPLSLR